MQTKNLLSRVKKHPKIVKGHYEHLQTEKSTVWEVRHNFLSSKPIFIMPLDRKDVWLRIIKVEYITRNRLRIYFREPVAGVALLYLCLKGGYPSGIDINLHI